MEVAIEAARQDPNRSWCLSTGPNLSQQSYGQLAQNCPPNVFLTRYIADLSQQMKLSQVSVSQCGYNTAMDALSAHRDSSCRAVFVPYDTEGQSEQLRRAQLLEQAGYAICLPQSQLTHGKLLTAIDAARNLPNVRHSINFDGAGQTAKILAEHMGQK